jgi:hypothetical protein
MDVLYMADNEQSAILSLDELIGNLNANDGWQFRCNEEDMRHELLSRGWYEGLNDNGHYLVLNIAKTELQPKAYWR